MAMETIMDPDTKLKEWCERELRVVPVYEDQRMLDTRMWISGVRVQHVPGHWVSQAHPTKAAARKEAARLALADITPETITAQQALTLSGARNALQTVLQSRGHPLPQYTEQAHGPDHQRTFVATVEVRVGMLTYAACGDAAPRKRDAHAHAALAALGHIGRGEWSGLSLQPPSRRAVSVTPSARASDLPRAARAPLAGATAAGVAVTMADVESPPALVARVQHLEQENERLRTAVTLVQQDVTMLTEMVTQLQQALCASHRKPS